MLTRYTQRLLIIGWLLLALYLMSTAANAQDADSYSSNDYSNTQQDNDGGDFPTIITRQGKFDIIQTGNGNVHVCTRQGAFVICN